MNNLGIMVAVKEERPDEAEIRELAEKMKEANKAKMAVPGVVNNTIRPLAPSNVNGQTPITNYVGVRSSVSASVKLPEDKRPIDEDSQRGRFGWEVLGTVPIPFILRQGEKYCAVRMVESKLLNKFLSYLHSDIYNYTNIRSYYITDAESRILNEINLKHCECHFGRDHFTNKDLVVRLQDAIEFYNFLEVCYNKLHYNTVNPSPRCGFIRINNESVVPYTLKDNIKYVPLFYFEGETDSLKLKAHILEGWDLAYLKFCCKVQGIRNELFASETCSVISLDDIMSYFPTGTQFDDYWPTKMTDCQLISKNPVANASWTRQPAGAVPAAPAAAKSTRQAAFPATPTPPTAGTPGASAALPHGAIPNWNNLVQQQQGMARMAALASNAQRAWPTNSSANSYYPFHTQMNMQQQQQPQKPLPPPLVRTPGSSSVLSHLPSNNVPMTEGNRTYALQKAMMRGPVIVSGAPRYVTDVMDLSGPQQSQYVMNGRGLMKDGRMVYIEDVPTSPSSSPYQLTKVIVEGRMVPCLNSEAGNTAEQLMTVPDLALHFFPTIAPAMIQKILQDVLKVNMYKGNRLQREVLRQHGKCRTEKDAPALIKVRDVVQYMPQLKYVINNKQQLMQQQQQAESVVKRMRIS